MERPELIAALVWDYPRLRESEAKGAREFADAMNLRTPSDAPDQADPLSMAAHAVIADATGESEDALAIYAQLSESPDVELRLLGLCLLCWSALDRNPVRIGEAQAEIERIDDLELRARLTAKLISAAFEYGWDELLPTLFAQAKQWAPEGSMLRLALEQEAYNLLGEPWPQAWDHGPDELTHYRWVRHLASNAAVSALTKGVEEMARSPWTLSFSIGGAPLNEPFAAEMQARWAGAIWLRSELQTQLAVQLLRGGASSPPEYASAVALWALGRGQQIPQIVDLAEPHFDERSADFVVQNLMRSGAVATQFDQRLIDAAVECWDLISEDTAVALLDRLRPVSTDHPIIRRIAVFWSLLALRVPEQWMERLADLSDEEALAVVTSMSPAVAERIPLQAARRLYRLSHATEEIEADSLPTIGTLKTRLGEVEGIEPEEEIPADVVVTLAWRESDLLDEGDLRNVVAKLTEQVEKQAEEARHGSASLGRANPLNTLAAALVKLDDLPRPTCDLLVAISTDPGTPRNMRYDAVKVLAAVVTHGILDLESLPDLIDEIPEAGAESVWASYSTSLMRAAKVELAMAGGKVEDYLPPLLVLSRDGDPRVRIDANEAAALGRRTENHDLLEAILLSGLFDPSSKVVQRALAGFTELPPQRPATQAAFGERLTELFAIGDREVRTAIARLATTADLPPTLADVGKKLAASAAKDRSFEVRSGAMPAN